MSNTNIKPLGARVLVEPLAAEIKTASGLIIPDSAKEKPQKAIVVAVGNGSETEKMEVKIGDTVLYGKYAGTQIQEEGKEYLILNQTDILAIV
jgi:chaperonin GroES